MFRPTARRVLTQSVPRNVTLTAQTSRFLSTAPPHKLSRSWKNSALRWMAAGGLVYYYNTSDLFAEEPSYKVYAPPETTSESETTASLEAVIAQREARKQAQLKAQQEAQQQEAAQPSAAGAAPGTVGELEEEASQQAAFNEETGEINWDCPCLGGMAHGPCGEQFRDAFSCFVFSQEEPKGVDCIDKFKSMQDCFRAHPDIYGSELDEDEVEDELLTPEDGEGQKGGQKGAPTAAHGDKVSDGPATPEDAQGKTERSHAATEQVKREHGGQTSETKEAVPKAWHDSK